MGFPCFGDSGVDLEAWMTVIVEPRRENALKPVFRTVSQRGNRVVEVIFHPRSRRGAQFDRAG
jgi:hypothetical protein